MSFILTGSTRALRRGDKESFRAFALLPPTMMLGLPWAYSKAVSSLKEMAYDIDP